MKLEKSEAGSGSRRKQAPCFKIMREKDRRREKRETVLFFFFFYCVLFEEKKKKKKKMGTYRVSHDFGKVKVRKKKTLFLFRFHFCNDFILNLSRASTDMMFLAYKFMIFSRLLPILIDFWVEGWSGYLESQD